MIGMKLLFKEAYVHRSIHVDYIATVVRPCFERGWLKGIDDSECALCFVGEDRLLSILELPAFAAFHQRFIEHMVACIKMAYEADTDYSDFWVSLTCPICGEEAHTGGRRCPWNTYTYPRFVEMSDEYNE
jgi:hypothetical protein